MDIAYAIAKLIEDFDGGTYGTDIFINNLPDGIDTGTYVVRVGGTLDNYTSIETSILDLYIVTTQSASSIATLEGLKRALHRLHSTEPISDVYIYSVLVIGDIDSLGRDQENQSTYKFSLKVMHRATAIIS